MGLTKDNKYKINLHSHQCKAIC